MKETREIGRIAAISVKCKVCNKVFTMNMKEVQWYSRMGYPLPKRCPECRKKRRKEREQSLRIAATLALNAVEEHLSGANIDWHDVARVLREALDERREDDVDKTGQQKIANA